MPYDFYAAPAGLVEALICLGWPENRTRQESHRSELPANAHAVGTLGSGSQVARCIDSIRC